jgi:ABC-type lipoprotein release transport system permease subunit
MLFETSTVEPGLWIGVAGTLAAVAVAAAALPAWRAARVNPSVALQGD